MAILTIKNSSCTEPQGGWVEYGLLYNWWAASTSNITSANDWVVPVYSDFQTLATYLGNSSGFNIAHKIKEVGLDYWIEASVTSTNESNFNGRGNGYRYSDGTAFIKINEEMSLWMSEEYSNNLYGKSVEITSSNDNFVFMIADTKREGRGVRLVRTSTTLSDGETGAYIGNDGKVYRTICIGTQAWTAENLAETKYRNDDIIPEVTDGTAWSNLTSGALCAYENDWNYVGRTKPSYY